MPVVAKPLIESQFASNSLTTEYTAPAGTRTIIDKFTATNTDSGAVDISVHLVPVGESADDSNIIVIEKTIAAGATEELLDLKNHVISIGGFISVLADVDAKVVIRASGREVV